MDDESFLWRENGESLTGLEPRLPPPLPPGHPTEGRQYYYANEERQKRLARFFSAVDEQAMMSSPSPSGQGTKPLSEAEFRANRQKLYATFLQQFRALRLKRIQGTEGYLIHSFRERIDLRIQQKYDVFLENREPIVAGDRVIGALNADGRGLDTITPYASTSEGKSLLRFLNQPTIASSIRAFGSTQKAMAVYGEDPNLKSQPVEGFEGSKRYEYYDSSPPASTCRVDEEFTSYTWRQDKDHPAREAIAPVQNQYTCGCCWALSTATSASDAFVIAGLLKKQPLLSWTALLSCAPACTGGGTCSSAVIKDGVSYSVSRQCGGGNFVTAAQWARNKGLVMTACSCYDWCSSNDGCKGTAKTVPSMTVLNKLIPGCDACTGNCLSTSGGDSSNLSKARFFLKNVTAQALTPSQANNATAIQNHIDIVKNWLKTKGSVTATFIVYKNFMLLPDKTPSSSTGVVASATTSTKTFVSPKNPGGVYLEFVGSDDKRASNLSNINILGAHAISIIGFSTDPVHWSLLYPSVEAACKSSQKMDKNGFLKVSSWVVRNSWGTSWNDQGYVKFATVPFNMSSTMDVTVQISTSTGSVSSGGMMLLEAGTVDFYPNPVLSAGDFTTASILKAGKDLVEKALASQQAPTPGPLSPVPIPPVPGQETPGPVVETPAPLVPGQETPAPLVPGQETPGPVVDTPVPPVVVGQDTSGPAVAVEDITGGAPSVEPPPAVVLVVPAAAAEGYVKEIESMFPHCSDGRCRSSRRRDIFYGILFILTLLGLLALALWWFEARTTSTHGRMI